MPPFVLEWLNLLVRWVHVIAGIMWIGDSFLFMWMDSHLEPVSRPRDGNVAGELWMVHSGGFYEVVKRRSLAPAEMPERLHWFKWQAYTTWLSGAALLAIVYWFGGAAFLLDRSLAGWSAAQAVGASAALLVAAWFVYDALWMSPLARRPRLAEAISALLLVGTIVLVTRVFPGRAAFLEVGAILGTVMAANVWRRIIPAQTQMLAATRAGTAVDLGLGARAKLRSTHNHYLTLPVVFCMLSNHFPSAYAHPWNALVLVLFVVFGAACKYLMNFRLRSPAIAFAALASLLALVGLTARPPGHGAASAAAPAMAPVRFATVRGILERRCTTCHSTHPSNPSFPEAPAGVMFDHPGVVLAMAPRIRVRAVETMTMPLGNLTGMTAAERDTIAAWIDSGARPE